MSFVANGRAICSQHRAPSVTQPRSRHRLGPLPLRPAARICSLLVACLLAATSAQAAATLSFEQRLACQATLEGIRWAETIWPAQNPDPKPDRRRVLSDAQLRDKVEDQLRQEAVLAEDYGQRIDAASLQRELDRMAAQSRAPDRLAKRFEALGNSPALIAECLARPHLVQQRLRAAYADDPGQHGALRRKAEAALASGTDAEAIEASGGMERTLVLRRDDPKDGTANAGVELDASELSLDAEAFDARLARLKAQAAGTDPSGQRSQAGSPLRNTDTAFVHEALLWQSGDLMAVQVRSWPKRSFDDWWAQRRGQSLPFQPAPVAGLKLPTIRGQATDLSKSVGDRWEPRLQEVPSERSAHSAVWTGSEMIVWGGTDFGGANLNTGGRYIPAIDGWGAPIATAGAPSARQSHSAVWTGNEMIVWGGFDGSNVATGGRYDPLSDTWTGTTASDGAPSSRSGHSAVWTGSEMIVWGGGASGFLNTGGRYDPDADAWVAATATSGAPSARIQHSAVWADGEMIVWGGASNVGALDSGARYDPDTDTWSAAIETSGAPSARYQHSAVWAGSQMIVWGGLDAFGAHINSGGRYDPASNAWAAATTASGAPSARRLHSAIWTGSEMIVWGGFDGNDTLLTGGRYDPLSNSWGAATATSAGVPSAREGHTAVWTGSEMIVWGGSSGGLLNDGSRYHPATNAWGPATSTAAAPSERRRHSAVWTGTEMIVWGGIVDLSGFGIPANSGGRYNPASNTWGAAPSMLDAPGARSGHSAIWTGSEMVVWGGLDGVPSFLDSGGRYDPGADAWGAATTLSGAPTPRDGHSAIWTGSEMIVWGGRSGGQDTGARYDPGTDSWGEATSLVNAASGRNRHSAVWTGSEMIVWGGSIANPFQPLDGGRFDPATNAWGDALSTVDEPSERAGHSAIWTGRAMIVWGGVGPPFATTRADMHLYFPYATASITSLESLAPSPSLVGGTVAATVQVASPDRAPVDGTVTVTASSGENCSDDAPSAIDALTVEFTCNLVFASTGTREVNATFSDSSSHDDSSSAAVAHAVKLAGTVVFDALAFVYDGEAKPLSASLAEDPSATCSVPESPVGPDAGDYPVSASCEGDTHIGTAATTASIARAEQTAFSLVATPPAILVDASSTLSAEGGSGEGAVSFALTEGAANCALEGDTVTGASVGTCTVTATKAADQNFLAASASVTVSVLQQGVFADSFE